MALISTLPPTMKYENGYVMCKTCHERAPVNLENLADLNCLNLVNCMWESVVYGCRFATFGCLFRSNGMEIILHERTCASSPYALVLQHGGCNWQGTRDQLRQHFDEAHKELIFYTSEKRFVTLHRTIVTSYAFYAFGTLFQVSWGLHNTKQQLKLVAEVEDSEGTDDQFAVDLTIFDKGTDVAAVSLRSACLYNNDLDSDHRNRVVLVSRLTKQYCDEKNRLHIKVKISRVND